MVSTNVDSGINKTLRCKHIPTKNLSFKGSIEVIGWVSDGNIWRKDGWTYSFLQIVAVNFIDPTTHWLITRHGLRSMKVLDK